MNLEVKRLYDEANQLHVRAKGILDEYKGKDLPGDKATEVDTLLDQVEAKTAEAKRLERADGMGDTFNKPNTNLPINQGNEGKGGSLSAETKSVLRQAGFKNAEIEERFFDEKEAKQAIATIMYWKSGFDSVERKDLATSPASAGGYLVTDTQRSELLEKQAPVSAMRRISRVLPAIPGGSSITPTEENELSDAEWTTEIKTGSKDEIKPFGGRILTPKPLAKRILISNTELRAGRLIDIESWITTRMGRRFGVPSEYAFINGKSANGPMGLLQWSGIPKYTTAASNVLAPDDIVNWAYSLPAAYAGTARILTNRSFLRKVRLLKDNNNQYLWQPGLSSGHPSTILDWAYELSDQYPTGLDGSDVYKDNELIATIGDFQYYWIVDSLNLSIKRLDELYAETDQTGFIGRLETDGMPVSNEAFYHLKVKA
jgi:HK97 family phage major capsid protein